MMLFDFQCKNCSTIFEEFAPDHNSVTICKLCKSEAHTIVSTASVLLDGTDPGFPRAWDKWSKNREQKMKQELRHKQS